MKDTIFALAMSGKAKELENLISKDKKDINKKEDLGYSPLAMSVARGYIDVVKILLENGADVNSQDDKGNTPLHYVGDNNYFEIAELLLKHGANISLLDNYDNEPLTRAVFNVKGDDDKLPLVKLLLDNGANPNNKNKSGISPLDFAKKVGDLKVVNVLTT
jgi:uncharacterized protein